MSHAINKRRVCACIAAVVVAIASLLCSTPTGAAEPISSWWSSTAFPKVVGESTLSDIKDVQVFVGYENARHGLDATLATESPLAYAWYQTFEGLDYHTYGYPSVYVRYGGIWVDISNSNPIDGTSEQGFTFSMHFYDGEECKDTETDMGDNYLSYAAHYQNVLSGTYGNARTCYWDGSYVYAVRWTAKTGNTTQKFCYFGVPHSEENGLLTNSGYYLGNKIHPAQATYWGTAATAQDYEEVIADLEADLDAAESEIEQLEKDKAQLEDDKDFAWQLGFDVGKGVGYEEGYEVGSLNGGAETVYIPHDYIIDDTSWQSQVISFVAICFRGVRDFIQPFFDIEFFGFSVFDMLTVLVVGSLVVGVVLFILKFVRG